MVLDEAQQAQRLFPCSLISATKSDKFCSIICEVVKVFTIPRVKLIVSGTGLSLAELEDSFTPGVSKHTRKGQVFHELGMFDTWRN